MHSHNHVHLHTTNPCRACEDISVWEDNYEEFVEETETARVRGIQREGERKAENSNQNNVIITCPPSRANEWH